MRFISYQVKHTIKKFNPNAAIIVSDLIKTLFIFGIATLFALYVVDANVISDNIFGVYMLAVAIISVITNGYFWGVLGSVAGVVAVNFFFTFPYFALNFTIAGYPITFLILLIMSILISTLTANVKTSASIAAAGKKRAESLNDMTKAFLVANDIDTLLDAAAESFYGANQCSVIIYLNSPKKSNNIRIRKSSSKYALSINNGIDSLIERSVAEKAFQTGCITGVLAEVAPQNCRGTYLPIVSKDVKYGVLGLFFEHPQFLVDDTIEFSEIMISQTILALDKQAMSKEAQRILLEKEKENMRSNLLRAVSHDLRTPLTCILGASTTLRESTALLTDNEKNLLLEDIQHDAQWLIHMVENLLTITKISSDGTRLKKQNELIEEVVSEVIVRIKKRFPESEIHASVPDNMLIVPMDPTLIEQVIINLIENAIRHSGSTMPISLTVTEKEALAVFVVSDKGKGVSPEQMAEIFSGASISTHSDSNRGLGIGLSICKTIIHAHGGELSVKNNEYGGASFTFVLPLEGDD